MSRQELSLVVDADVARACPTIVRPDSEPRAKSAKRALDTIRNQKRLVVAFSGKLHEEWRSNRSNYAKKWLTDMYGRKRVRRIEVVPWEPFRRAIRGLSSECSRQAGEKDAHLVELAHQADHRIVSFDVEARSVFSSLTLQVVDLSHLHWANPIDAGCLEWLERVAPDDIRFTLGAA